ncbi:helix-turn-helix transcriptional regulator [Croceitalea rosinachiae]|uniref:Helix-turn-helix transcriptional regulator n=1 Tax=Croceitalea rosinachiae TaxID=3075596 RepID=A0ABU3AE80_9FLAO|nr:helix-turn-helix transcriptional regulator [Croceitalea sp. F388]MDT0607408.1 helix-turn-helix transcriptional regulator [Croceitalea sp. F388]
MGKEPIPIKFQNKNNPKAGFDIILLEDLLARTDLDHSLEEIQKVEFFILILVTKGNGKHSIDFKEYKTQKGTLLTIRKDQIQKFHISKGLKGKVLLFTNEFLVSYLEKQETQKTLQLFNELLGEPKLELPAKILEKTITQIQRIEHEYFDVNDKHSLGIIRSELQILIANLFRLKSRYDTPLFHYKRLNDFIRFQNEVEANINTLQKVSDYSDLLGLSSKTLNKITKTVIHKTAKAFLDETHLKQIKRQLINSKDSIKRVALTTGFEETSNFYKFFKRHTGLTPEQFRSTYN